MKLHNISIEQARFIWMRNGAVYKMVDCGRRTLPMTYNGEDYIDGIQALAEKRIINQFSKRSDYPGGFND